jgi:hypothetical protein
VTRSTNNQINVGFSKASKRNLHLPSSTPIQRPDFQGFAKTYTASSRHTSGGMVFLLVVVILLQQHLGGVLSLSLSLSSPLAHDPHHPHSHHSNPPTAGEVEFKKSCDPSTFSMTSPETILPQVSTKSRPSNEEILMWYGKGLEECKAAYLNKSTGYQKEKVGPPLMNTELHGRNNECRGNAMLYQITGMLIWPFGPIDQCPINSECWFGYLACGHFEKEKVIKLFSSGARPNLVQTPDFNPTWSIRSLDITTRIVGLESLVPLVSYVNITKSEPVPVEILLAQYTLTIPGDYTIEMRLQGFYPGILHQWKPGVLQKGVEMYHSVFLGGCEGRCPPYQNCGPYNIPLCDVKSFVGNPPYRMRSAHRHVDCPSTAHSSDPLPFCQSGNHPGRWIRIPESVIEVCGIAKFENDLVDERKRQQGKRQDFGRYSAITTAYAAHTQHLSPDKMWESVKLIDPHASANEKIYLEILQRYSGGNLCSLATVEGPLTPLDGKLELFAPYGCRYHLFSSAQVMSNSSSELISCRLVSVSKRKEETSSPFMEIACRGISMPPSRISWESQGSRHRNSKNS